MSIAETQVKKFYLKNLDCADCAAKVERSLQGLPGVRFAAINFATLTLHIDTDDMPGAVRKINDLEPEIELLSRSDDLETEIGIHSRRDLAAIVLATFLFIIGLIFQSSLHDTPFNLGEYLVFGSAYLLSGWGVLTGGFRSIRRGKFFGEAFLMTVATLGAVLIHELPEAVGVMLFYKVGEYVQGLSVARSRRSIKSLLEIRPDSANLMIDSELRIVEPTAVDVGDTILVKPGEKIPLDGEILTGSSFVDTSSLTGEPVPRPVKVGEMVLAGMINQTGMLTLRVTKRFAESSIARILELVENASSRKAKTERFITRFANVYSPIVVGAALLVAVLPPLFIPGAAFGDWIYRALVLLVISCPCALMISIPLGYFGGVGGASRRGILVKGANFLDALAEVKTVVFDKTGTLTRGVFKVTEIVSHNGFSDEEFLRLAAQAESQSSHPIAQSIRISYGDHNPTVALESYQEVAGFGVKAKTNEQVIIVGSDALLHQEKVPHVEEVCDVEGTVVHMALDGVYAGYLVVSDELKRDAVQAVSALREVGVRQIIILTGDQETAAEAIAQRLGVDEYRAELLPEDKVRELEEIMQSNQERGRIAYVGDGINDAPVIARADVGIAMGALGADAAIETADVVIMTDAPSKIAEAIQVGRFTRRVVWQNIILALAVKLVFIGLGVVGLASMWAAVFADVGVTVLAVFNAARVITGGDR